ncbi:COX15/CtaA family protein [Pseudactinotalea sp. Z1748]|uniref:COX15/CtaA family protein n=1 Tax=Pseudactinotalea sp. Z1748 TaxID=3413027 RepID=UPI003C7BE440
MDVERVRRWIPGVAWANLVVQIGIIITGGAVRLTGSGLGCSTWPNCEPGQFTPQLRDATDFHGAIEFGNRALAAVVFVVALSLVVLLVVAGRKQPHRRRRGLEALAAGIAAGVLIQAVVGGMTVWFELHPALVGSHFLLSGVLVAASSYLLSRLREGDGPPRPLAAEGLGPVRTLVVVLMLVTAVLVVLGVIVTGAGPHSGDQDVGYRFAVDPVSVARVHAGAAWAFTATVIALLVLLHRARANVGAGAELTRARRRTWVLLAVTLAQGVVGYVQYFTGLPELLVGIHLFAAAVLIAAVTFTVTGLRVREPVPATETLQAA